MWRDFSVEIVAVTRRVVVSIASLFVIKQLIAHGRDASVWIRACHSRAILKHDQYGLGQ